MSDGHATEDSQEPDESPVAEESEAVVLRFPSVPDLSAAPSSEASVERSLRHLLGDVLRAERLDQERTLADVARTAAVSLPYLSEVERGRKEISSELLGAVCDSLGIPLVNVLERCVDRLRAGTQGGSGVQLRAA